MKQYILDRIRDVAFGFIFILFGITSYNSSQENLFKIFISLSYVVIGIGFIMHSLTIKKTGGRE